MARNTVEVSLLGKVAAYTEILAGDPGSTVFLSLCDTYRQMGLLEEALEVARRGVEAMPNFAAGHIMVGRLLAEGGDLEGAGESYEKALVLDGKSLPALKGLARVCFRRGDLDRTRALLEEAHIIRPEDPTVRQMLSFFSKSSPPINADPPPAPAVEKSGEPIATSTIAEIYMRQGLPRRALQVYRDLLRSDPSNFDLRRKFEELEERIREEEEGEVVAAEPDLIEESTQAVAEPVPAIPLGVRQIELLTRWAEAARRRRANVQ